MPLENLYTKSPMEEYAALPFGMQWGMGSEGAAQYQQRQQQRDQLVDMYNKQAVTEMNPAQIQQQTLANQQQQHMMPTYEVQGTAAKAKLDTPDYFKQSAAAEMAGFGATAAKNKVEEATAQGQLPFARGIAHTTSSLKQDSALRMDLAQWVANFRGTPEELLATAKAEGASPYLYKWLQTNVAKHGVEKTKASLLAQMHNVAQTVTSFDPTLLAELAKLAEQAKGQIAVANTKTAAQKEYEDYITSYIKDHPTATRNQAHAAWIKEKNPDKVFMTPEGVPYAIEGKRPQGSAGQPQPGAALPEAPRDPLKRTKGTRYQTPKGPFTWTGEGWIK